MTIVFTNGGVLVLCKMKYVFQVLKSSCAYLYEGTSYATLRCAFTITFNFIFPRLLFFFDLSVCI